MPPGEPDCRFTVPIPPSTNNLYRGGPRYKTDTYDGWINDAGWIAKAQHPYSVKGRVAVRIEAPFNRRRDLDNIKPILDLAVKLGLIEDDNRVDDLHIVRTTGEQVVVSVWKL